VAVNIGCHLRARHEESLAPQHFRHARVQRAKAAGHDEELGSLQQLLQFCRDFSLHRETSISQPRRTENRQFHRFRRSAKMTGLGAADHFPSESEGGYWVGTARPRRPIKLSARQQSLNPIPIRKASKRFSKMSAIGYRQPRPPTRKTPWIRAFSKSWTSPVTLTGFTAE